MGPCVSVQKSSGSSLKVQMSSIVPDDKDSIPSTPVKDKSSAIVDPPLLSVGYNKSQISPLNSFCSYRSHGSKDETFYDTQTWLDSDCDDDFYSVNGDFTSRGSTPVHDSVGSSRYIRTFSPQVNRALFDGRPPRRSASNRSTGGTPLQRSSSAASPRVSVTSSDRATSQSTSSTTKRKKLADLFRESFRERAGEGLTFGDSENTSSSNAPALQHNLSSNCSSSSLKRGPNSTFPHDKVKAIKFAQCGCLPRLVPNRSLRENKKTFSPSMIIGSLKNVKF